MDVRLDRLEEKHTSGLAADGKRWKVRGAPVGALIRARPGRKQTARRQEILESSPRQVSPECGVFGVCGGCQLQEMSLAEQRHHKGELVTRLVSGEHPLGDVCVHPTRGAERAYGYRNKMELSWGTKRYVPDSELEQARAEDSLQGSFLGFHPPGWFSKIVPISVCPLATSAINGVISAVSALGLAPAWNTVEHTGNWRHLVVRDSGTVAEPSVLVALVTSSSVPRSAVADVAQRIREVPHVSSVVWVTTDRLSEVAHGDLREVFFGRPTLLFRVRQVVLELPYDGFFQVNTEGLDVLVDTVEEALFTHGGQGGTLVDLYCGAGMFGLALSPRFNEIVGIEIHEGAVECARRNAEANGVQGRWIAGPVEDVLADTPVTGAARVLVDPPRAGLHPKVARALAVFDAEVLVYVACGPKSLGRDRAILEAGHWKMTDLWTVDLFPQTQHCEAVARFVRV